MTRYPVELIDPRAEGYHRRWHVLLGEGVPCGHQHGTHERAVDCALEHDHWPMCRAKMFDGEECARRASKFVKLVPLCDAHRKFECNTAKAKSYTGKDRKLRVVGERPTDCLAQYLVCEGLPKIRSKDGAAWRLIATAPSYVHARKVADLLCDPRLGAACIELDAPGLEFVS